MDHKGTYSYTPSTYIHLACLLAGKLKQNCRFSPPGTFFVFNDPVLSDSFLSVTVINEALIRESALHNNLLCVLNCIFGVSARAKAYNLIDDRQTLLLKV